MIFGLERRKKIFLILSWALYDLANQFFALNIISFYFPRWLTFEQKCPEIFYSISFGFSMFLVAICAPFLGAISDIKGRRKAFLIFFTLLSIVFTISLSISSNIFLALIFFAFANFGCQQAVVFYNALLVNVAPQEKIGLISGVGRMFGYTGAIVALGLTKPVILKVGYQATFLVSGVLFLIFSLPCMIFVKDKPSRDKTTFFRFFRKEKLRQILKNLKDSLFSDRNRELTNFLKAVFFGLCAVNTVILFMSIYASKVFGLREVEIINLIVVSTIFAIGASALSGLVSDILGPRRSLIGVYLLWIACFLAGGLLKPPFHWLVGPLAGISLGSIWVVFRALVIKLVPQRIGEAFGLFNLVGYLAAIVGPLFWGLALFLFSSLGEWRYRLTLLSLILFMAFGSIFLFRLPRQVISR